MQAVLTGPQGENPSGIVAAEDSLRNAADGLLQKFHVGQIIQVDNGSQPICQLVFLRQGVVGGEHDLPAPEAAALRQHQFRQAGAVGPAALGPQRFQNGGIRGGLDGKILPESGIPGKGGVKPPGVFPYALFVVEVKGGGVLSDNFVQLLFCYKRCFHLY